MRVRAFPSLGDGLAHTRASTGERLQPFHRPALGNAQADKTHPPIHEEWLLFLVTQSNWRVRVSGIALQMDCTAGLPGSACGRIVRGINSLAAPHLRLRAQTFGQAVGSSIAQQLIILLLAGAILDRGLIFELCGFAAVAFWIGVAVIWFRRHSSPSWLDLLVIEAGYVVLCVVSYLPSY